MLRSPSSYVSGGAPPRRKRQRLHSLSLASGGSGCAPPTKYVATVNNDVSGVITATTQSTSGLNAETFVLIPGYSAGRVDWSTSGTGKTRAGGALCCVAEICNLKDSIHIHSVLRRSIYGHISERCSLC